MNRRDKPSPARAAIDRRSLMLGALAAPLAALGAREAQAQEKAQERESSSERALSQFGVVLMHGKGGGPGGPIASLAEYLRAQGARVAMPRMGWAGDRGRPAAYAQSFPQALQPIGAALAQLRADGARKLVLAGQSLGANAAIAWAARNGGGGLAGVVALAAGHTPERMRRPEILAALEQARALAASGQGKTRRMFPDINQGQSFDVEGSAEAWLSYYEPDGPANMPRNAARMPALPFLWVIGRRDMLHDAGAAYAFDRAPRHAKSRYLVVDAGHIDTPDRARAEVAAWLRAL
jgi:pimeloyl-ACP methyl ester carboxylesterase